MAHRIRYQGKVITLLVAQVVQVAVVLQTEMVAELVQEVLDHKAVMVVQV
jgi:hypothetical protein